ncbi:unnamed protein product [Urochloa humidicola]
MVLIWAKAFTDTLAGGSGGGALGASFSSLGEPLRAPCPTAWGSRVKTLSGSGQATAAPSVSRPPWRRRLLRPVLACGSDGGGLFGGDCPCAAAEVVRKVRVGGEVQRAHGCWKTWADAYGAVVILVTA